MALAKGDHVVVDGPERGVRVEAAHLLDDLDPWHDLAAPLREHLEHQDVVRRQIQTPLRARRRQRAEVEAHAGDRHLGQSRRLRLGPPQQGAHACQKLALGERLRQVVVGSQLEADDAIDDVALWP